MVVTVEMLTDYLSQFPGNTEVVISMDDFGADATDDRIDNAVSITSAFEAFALMDDSN